MNFTTPPWHHSYPTAMWYTWDEKFPFMRWIPKFVHPFNENVEMTPDEYFKFCVETRNFEINQLVSRNNFFMIFQGVLFAGLAQSSGSAPPVVSFLICLVGVFSAIFQAFMASGAKWWQERWELAVNEAETNLLEKNKISKEQQFPSDPLFALDPSNKVREKMRNDKNFWKVLVRRHSVSAIPIYTGYCFLIVWCVFLACTIENPWHSLIPDCIVGFPKSGG